MIFQFDSLLAFMAMGGHGIYVWACYAITLGVLALLAVVPLWQRRQLVIQLQRQQKIAQGFNSPSSR